MKKTLNLFVLSALCFTLLACETIGVESGASMVSGVRNLLLMSSKRTGQALSVTGGYASNSDYVIEVSDRLRVDPKLLETFGLDKQILGIERHLNRVAESAARDAIQVFQEEIRTLAIVDAWRILDGGRDAATQYFEEKTRSRLGKHYRQLIVKELDKSAYYDDYRRFQTAYKLIPIPNKPSLDFEAILVEEGLDAIYKQMSIEERKIRKNPEEMGKVLLGVW